jgi:nicotinamide-nucleotide amidase
MTPDDEQLYELARRVVAALIGRRWRMATAESCSGGWIAKAVTDVAGSSACFECGLVTYSNAAKVRLAGVDAALLETHGAVSEAVVQAMAASARALPGVDVAVAVSGIAGPDGGTPDKPVGTVCFAWATADHGVHSERRLLHGDRDQVRRLTVQRALDRVLELAGE